jgi:voltage-gated potassium channel
VPLPLQPALSLPSRPRKPARTLAARLAVALGLIAFVALVAYLGGDGYRDGDEDPAEITLLDAFYYASVSVTTTGYGDITPVTDGARLATTLLITPARILFLILLVGTTVEVLAESSRIAYQRQVWRRRLRDHTIVCGFGTKGRHAIATLTARGVPVDKIVVIDESADAVEEATRSGFAAIHGDATRSVVLQEAGIEHASGVVVAPHTDEAAVLTTLTAREHNPTATIVAAVRELENRHLVHQSGANSAIVTAGAAGKLLGFATDSPQIVEVLEDLLSVGTGLDIVERVVDAEDDGRPLTDMHREAPVVAIARGEAVLRFDDAEAQKVRAGDRLVCLCSNRTADGRKA